MHEAKTRLSQLVEAVEQGTEGEIVIARNGKPVAKLVPFGTRQRRPIGRYDGIYPDITLDAFNAQDEDVARLFLAEGGPATPRKRRVKR